MKKKPCDTLDQVVKKLSIITEFQQEGVKKVKPVMRSDTKSPLMKVMSKQHIGKMKKKGNFHSHSQITTIRSKKASKQMNESHMSPEERRVHLAQQ